MFLINKSAVIGGLESSAYSASGETLESADYAVRIRNEMTYSTEIAEYRRKILDGTLDYLTSVMGRQQGTVGFPVDMAPSATGSEDTPPAWGYLLKACGFKETIYAGTGVGYVPHSDYTHVPASFHVVEQLEGASADMLVTRYQGAMGNVTIAIGTVGEPIKLLFEFSGAWNSVTDLDFVNKLDPTSLSVIKPGAMLSSDFTVNSIVQDHDTFEYNMNNELSEWIYQSHSTGLKGFYISDRVPQLTLNPTMKQLATEPGYTELKACTTLATSTVQSTTGGPDITISAPAAQRITQGIGDRNGARAQDWGFLLTKGVSAGNNVFEILQGAKS